MTGIQPPRPEGEFEEYAGFSGEGGGPAGRRRLARYGVPVAVVAVAATTIGIGTALASTGGGPSLPAISTRQLLTKMADSHVRQFSGSVRVTTDLGLPSALTSGAFGQAVSGTAGGTGKSGTGNSGTAKSGAASATDPAKELATLIGGSHTLQVAADGPTRERVSFADGGSTYTVVRGGNQLWYYDSAAHTVYHATRPAAAGDATPTPSAGPSSLTPAEMADRVLSAAGPTTSITVDGTAEVAGQSAYQLLIKPKQSGSTVGSIRIAVDAANGVPLAFTLAPSGGGDPVLDVAFTSVSFATPPASDFSFSAPKGTHVTEAKPDTAGHPAAPKHPAAPTPAGAGRTLIGKGWTTVAELHGPAGENAAGAAKALALLGKKVTGSFGTGTLISTRLVNVLVTDNGTVFAGAVTPATLLKAADSATAAGH